MFNFNNINESVATEMARLGVGRKGISESEAAVIKLKNRIEHVKDLIAKAPMEDKVKLREILKGHQADLKKAQGGKLDEAEAKAKRIDVKVTTKSDSWVTGFNGTPEEAKAYFMGKKFETRDEKPGDPVIKVEVLGEAEGDTDNDPGAFGAGAVESDPIDPTDTPTDTPAHDETGEEEEDPTREKLETPEDEADEQKGGAAELAADLRVSVRIEKMNLNRYKRMMDKHELSEDGQNWLKEKIQDIQDAIDDMQERIPQLEKEAEEQAGTDAPPEDVATEIQEAFGRKLKQAIIEIASGKPSKVKDEEGDEDDEDEMGGECECGRHKQDCATYNDPDADHGDA